jgi:hypothetical protein
VLLANASIIIRPHESNGSYPGKETSEMSRIIGIQHRVKRTADDEPRPTKVCILENSDVRKFELETEDDELDFARGQYPVAHRKIESETDLDGHLPRHIKWRRAKVDEDLANLPSALVRLEGKTSYVASQVPSEYDGLKAGDRVAMLLGGSGDRMAFALSRFGESIGATVHRIPQYVFKPIRGGETKDNDAQILATLLWEDPDKFYVVAPRDRSIIRVSEAYRARRFTQKDRIACEQRMRQQAIGSAFICDDGGYPEGTIEEAYDRIKANSEVYAILCQEETRRTAELKVAVHAIQMWQDYFKGVKGCGPVVAGGLIAAIQDIRRFIVEPDPVKLQTLREERTRLLTAGRFEEFLLEVRERVTDVTSLYQQVQMVRSWQEAHGHEAEAQILNQAIGVMKQSHRLRRDASRRTVNRVVAFCGVHVRQGGRYAEVPASKSFPRRRKGETTNYNPIARQALYLLTEQFNLRQASKWGQRLLENKARLNIIHPEPMDNSTGGKRWSKVHIHRTALWRSVTQFVREFAREWLRYESMASQSSTDANVATGTD